MLGIWLQDFVVWEIILSGDFKDILEVLYMEGVELVLLFYVGVLYFIVIKDGVESVVLVGIEFVDYMLVFYFFILVCFISLFFLVFC